MSTEPSRETLVYRRNACVVGMIGFGLSALVCGIAFIAHGVVEKLDSADQSQRVEAYALSIPVALLGVLAMTNIFWFVDACRAITKHDEDNP